MFGSRLLGASQFLSEKIAHWENFQPKSRHGWSFTALETQIEMLSSLMGKCSSPVTGISSFHDGRRYACKYRTCVSFVYVGALDNQVVFCLGNTLGVGHGGICSISWVGHTPPKRVIILTINQLEDRGLPPHLLPPLIFLFSCFLFLAQGVQTWFEIILFHLT